MIDSLVRYALRHRIVVVVLAVALLGVGASSVATLAVDAFPDVTNVQVMVATEAPGNAPEDVERLVTIPVEIAMAGLPGLTQIRSVSRNALSQVTLVFADGVDVYAARAMVLERLVSAEDRLPPGVTPLLGPVTTGLSEVYLYTLELPDDGKRALSEAELTERRTLQEWVVRPMLRGVPGVAEVASVGGFERQYQVLVDPEKLTSYELTARDVYEAVALNNANSGGGVLPQYEQQFIVRGIGLIGSLDDLRDIVLREQEGTPIFVRDVAEVGIGRALRYGGVVKGGYTEAVGGIVLMQAGGNARAIVTRVKERVEEMNREKLIPGGLQIVPFYDRSLLVDAAVATVTGVLVQGIVLVVALLIVFLGDWRSSLIVVATLVLTPLLTFVVMGRVGITANLMSLGGMAIAIGMMVDGSVVMVENAHRHLTSSKGEEQSTRAVVQRAAAEVGTPIFFGVGVICLVFVPLMTLQGMEGKMFAPLAYVIAIALFVSLILSLTLSPAMCSYLLRGHGGGGSKLVDWIQAPYLKALKLALRNGRSTLMISAGMLVGSWALVPLLGTSFVPEMKEGSLVPAVYRSPNMSLAESIELELEATRRMAETPGVALVVSSLGRGGDPAEVQPEWQSTPIATLLPAEELPDGWTQDDVTDAIRESLADVPGGWVVMSQPISARVDEMVAGVRAALAIKVFGDDLDLLLEKAEAVAAVVREVPGAQSVQVEQAAGQQYLTIVTNRDAIARFGLNVDDVNDVIETAVGGRRTTEIYEGERRFAAVVRFPEQFRDRPEAIGRILLRSPTGAVVPLLALARIEVRDGPVQISREKTRRRVVVASNVTGRDLGGFVSDVQRAVAERVPLPEGYSFEWGGQFENLERARERLSLIIPLTVAAVFFLLFLFFDSVKGAVLIILVVPFATIGGILGLLISGEYLSVPASVGFITLGGIAVLNGVVLISFIRDLEAQGRSRTSAIVRGCRDRLRPVLMTATTTLFGLVPFLFATGPGAEVQRPLAVVVIGGLMTCTPLTLLVVPVLYRWFAGEDGDEDLA
ncbi:MAG: CusA/CzcA family heavy metal efflux RND transporter [Myxococcota bacterium]|nr:CusA/CzcA family heavy metal efflux RND transporter [Myxococcota bacterium]